MGALSKMLKKVNIQELRRLVEFEMDNVKADKHKAPRDGDCSWDQADPEGKKNWMDILGIEDGDQKDEKIIYKGIKNEAKINEGAELLANETMKKIFTTIRSHKDVNPDDVISLVDDIMISDAKLKSKANQVKDSLRKILEPLKNLG